MTLYPPAAAITGNSDQYWFAKASITLMVYICAGLFHLAVESRDFSQAEQIHKMTFLFILNNNCDHFELNEL